ncbi:hypothetical protein GCM10009632_04310 [Mycolicibacterium alvei]
MMAAVDGTARPGVGDEFSDADEFTMLSRYAQALIAGCHEVLSSTPGDARAKADLRALLDEGPPRGRPLRDPR